MIINNNKKLIMFAILYRSSHLKITLFTERNEKHSMNFIHKNVLVHSFAVKPTSQSIYPVNPSIIVCYVVRLSTIGQSLLHVQIFFCINV